MLKREWLATQGLAIMGARGQLSLRAKERVNQVEAECNTKGTSLPWNNISEPHLVTGTNVRKVTSRRVVAEAIDKRIPVREETILYYLDKGKFSTTLIALDSCGGCGKSIRYCKHETPLVPKYLGGGAGLLVKPVINA